MTDASDIEPVVAGPGDVLPPNALPKSATATQSLALVQRLGRSQPPSTGLQAALDGPLHAAVQAAATYAQDSLAAPTRDAYQRDWSEFAAWCHAHGADPGELPVNPVLVAAWLAGLAPTHGASALRRRLAAIAHHHRRRGVVFTPAHPAIRETLAGIRRAHPNPVRPAAALTSAEIKRLIATCPDDLPGLRDRALLLVGFAGAFRRSELVGIDHHQQIAVLVHRAPLGRHIGPQRRKRPLQPGGTIGDQELRRAKAPGDQVIQNRPPCRLALAPSAAIPLAARAEP